MLNLNFAELFELSSLRFCSYEVKSIKPEAKFLFKYIDHMSIYFDRQLQDPCDLRDFVKFFEVNLVDKSKFTVNLKFPIYIDTGERIRSNLGEKLEPLKDQRVKELEVCTEDSNYSLSDLNEHTFRKFKVWHESLSRLVITIFTVERVGPDAFSSFKNLDYLGLDCLLGLSELSVNAFRGLNKLTELSVSESELKRLEEGTFDHLESLEELHLSEGKLKNIQPGFFMKLKHLRLLDMKRNQLNPNSRLATFGNLKNLKGDNVYESTTNPREKKSLPEDLLPSLDKFMQMMTFLQR